MTNTQQEQQSRLQAIADSLGITLDPLGTSPNASRSTDRRGIELMISEAEQERAVAAIMDDEKRQRIVGKTLGWLKSLKDQAESLSALANEVCSRVAEGSESDELNAMLDKQHEQTVEAFEWALVAVTRWIERQLPLDKRRDSSYRFTIEWQNNNAGTATWKNVEMQPVSFRGLVLDCFQVEGGFSPDVAGAFAEHVLLGVRAGDIWLPRLTRVDSSTDRTTTFQLRPRDDRTLPPGPKQDDESASGKYASGVPIEGILGDDVEWFGYAPWSNLEEEAFLSRQVPSIGIVMDEAVCRVAARRPEMAAVEIQGGSIASAGLQSLTTQDVSSFAKQVANLYQYPMPDTAAWLSRAASIRLVDASEREDSEATVGYARLLDGLNQVMAVSKK